MPSKAAILESIQQPLIAAGVTVKTLQWRRDLGGGDINQAALIADESHQYFLKYHADAPPGIFEAEAKALAEMATLDCIRVPVPLAFGESGNTHWLLLEHLELGQPGSDAILGEQLAAMHQRDFGRYGWNRDNFIGTTPQSNRLTDSWMMFWRDQRIQPQLKLAEANGFGGRLQSTGEQLLQAMPQLLGDHQPVASLLHGDLWAGNKSFGPGGQPVIFDPASYYGDHEADIAMTELFGGFGREFYAAYYAHMAADHGYRVRRELYNLYHVLNHLNLFGHAYLGRSEHMIASLLAEAH